MTHRMSAILAICLALSAQAWGAVIHVAKSGGNANTGMSWEQAKATVQAGIDSASAGDEVWVASGVYDESVTLKVGVALYGGFAGAELSRDDRDWTRNRTTIDAAGLHGWNPSPVTIADGSDSRTRVDGLTIRGGYLNPGVRCYNGSAVIVNNYITGNNATYGGGVFCSRGTPQILRNRIVGNVGWKSGGGIYCVYGGAIVCDNVISGNSAGFGGGVYCDYGSSALITSNTITHNYSTGAIYTAQSWPVVANNLIAYNTSGLCNTSTTFTLVAQNNCFYDNRDFDCSGMIAEAGSVHADPRFVSPGYGDLHIQPDSPCVDAADEDAPRMGSTDVDGQPRRQPAGGRMDIGADESDGVPRSMSPRIVRVTPQGSDDNDGSGWEPSLAMRTVQSALAAAAESGGQVWLKQGLYNECVKLPPFAYLYGGFGGGEAELNQRDWARHRSIIDGGEADFTVAAELAHGVTSVDGCVLRGGRYGVVNCSKCSTRIANNIITNGASEGIRSAMADPVIVGNVIASNPSGGVYCQSGSPVIVGNTIVDNTAYWGPVGVYGGNGAAIIQNNIIAFNAVGLQAYQPGDGAISNNCVYGNRDYNYRGLEPGVGDISADPLFADREHGDYHLTSASPCINAGKNDAPSIPVTDIDGQPRIQRGVVDIGADEYWQTPADARRAPDGEAIELYRPAVTAAFLGFLYVESDDRVSGVRVGKANHGLAAGMRANIAGVAATSPDGERYIAATSVLPDGTGTILPLALSNPALGGGSFGLQSGVWGWKRAPGDDGKPRRVWGEIGGPNNIGLLVRIWGRVTTTTASTFTIDDGSGEAVECLMPPGIAPDQSWQYVSVTGISSCKRVGEEIHRLLRVRSREDVVRIQ